jgi:hypothetical protein
MKKVSRHARDLDLSDRRAVEHILGHNLQDDEKVEINVVPEQPERATPSRLSNTPWAAIYEGLSDEDVDQLSAAIRQRADLSTVQ